MDPPQQNKIVYTTQANGQLDQPMSWVAGLPLSGFATYPGTIEAGGLTEREQVCVNYDARTLEFGYAWNKCELFLWQGQQQSGTF